VAQVVKHLPLGEAGEALSSSPSTIKKKKKKHLELLLYKQIGCEGLVNLNVNSPPERKQWYFQTQVPLFFFFFLWARGLSSGLYVKASHGTLPV
jgi:hypothetical protein